MSDPEKSSIDILPDIVKRPLLLALIWLIPQAVLLCLNLRAHDLVEGELTGQGQALFSGLLIGNVSLLIAGALFATFYFVTRKPVSLLACIPILIINILYLGFVFMSLGDLLPASTESFILPSARFLFFQFCFVMPVVFYALLRISLFPVTTTPRKNAVISTIAAFGLPTCWYFSLVATLSILQHEFAQVIFFISIATVTILALAAVIRAASFLTNYLLNKGPYGEQILALLIAFIFPLIGLGLNASIPFPFDFQSGYVYLLCVLNGALLMLPPTNRPVWDRLIWIGRTVSFSFTAYFFFVFLPFTPLSMLAMIIFGAGLLMLVPTALFIFHTMLLARGFQAERERSNTGVATGLLVLGLMAVPTGYTLRALQHKQTIHAAIDYIYEADPLVANSYAGNRTMLKHTLKRMHAAKNGYETPFLTAYYNWLVFDGLVLPDHKLQHIHKSFFGSELESNFSVSEFDDWFSPSPAGNRNMWQNNRTFQVPTTAKLNTIEWSTTPEGSVDRVRAVLNMENPESGAVEFATTIQLPPYALLSNFHLWIGKNKMPGHIFERKSAMWIYEKIRDTTVRDPGIVTYLSPEEIELRIYPFAGREKRKAEIEFLIPRGLGGSITIDGQKHTIEPSEPTAHWIKIDGLGGQLDLPPETDLPSFKRIPYLHFVFDRSESAPPIADQLAQAATIADSFPDARGYRITLANCEFQDLVPQTETAQVLGDISTEATLTAQGGFMRDRAIKRILLQHQADCSGPNAEKDVLQFPRIIVLQAQGAHAISEDLVWHANLSPDEPFARIYTPAETMAVHHFDPEETNQDQQAVALLVTGSTVVAVPVIAGKAVHVRSLDPGVKTPEWLDPTSGKRKPVEGITDHQAQTPYAIGASCWLNHDRVTYFPTHSTKQLPTMVAQSRASGVLVPETAYIVLENSAQYKLLERVEKQKLENSSALETPEPDVLILLAGFAIYMLIRRRVHRFRR